MMCKKIVFKTTLRAGQRILKGRILPAGRILTTSGSGLFILVFAKKAKYFSVFMHGPRTFKTRGERGLPVF